jgi:hypothetical protein
VETIHPNKKAWVRVRLPNDLAEKIDDKGDRDHEQNATERVFQDAAEGR